MHAVRSRGVVIVVAAIATVAAAFCLFVILFFVGWSGDYCGHNDTNPGAEAGATRDDFCESFYDPFAVAAAVALIAGAIVAMLRRRFDALVYGAGGAGLIALALLVIPRLLSAQA